MERWSILLLDSFIIGFALYYSCCHLLNIKINLKRNFHFYLFFVLYLFVSYIVTDSVVRIGLMFIILSALILKTLRSSVIESFIVSFISLASMLVSEIIFAICIVFLFKIDPVLINTYYFGDLPSNITIAVITYMIIRFTPIKKHITKFINSKNGNETFVIVFSLVTMLVMSMLVYYLYFEIKFIVGLFLGLIIIIVYIIIMFTLFKERSDNNKLQLDYELTLDSLNQYEDMYSRQRMKNHEFKNELSIIRGMLNTNNKKAISYIDEIIDFKNETTKDFMEILKRIPDGGLRGILYYKLSIANDKGVKIDFTTAKNFKSKDYTKLSEKTKLNICKLLGIYLDNAIQATNETENKYIYIHINNIDNNIIFRIANTFTGSVDTGKIYEKGYSTKRTGRGHGLPLAKNIIEKDKSIKNITSISGDKFVQEIKIKM